MNTPKLTVADAGRITRLLWEYESFNSLRKLVNELIATGVTLEQFSEFARLPSGGPQHLVVDIYNLLSHLDKGVEIYADELHQIPESTIAKRVRESIKAQQAVVAQSAPPPWQFERDR